MHLSNRRYLLVISIFIFIFHHAGDRRSPIPPLVKLCAWYQPMICYLSCLRILWHWYYFDVCNLLLSIKFHVWQEPSIYNSNVIAGSEFVLFHICFQLLQWGNICAMVLFFHYVLKQICHCRIYLNYSSKKFSSIMEYAADWHTNAISLFSMF